MLTYKEKNSFISKQFQGYAVRWYTNARYNLAANKQFKNSLFEGCYGNIHTKKQIRDQVEYGKYQDNGRFTLAEYVIQRVERSKYLRSRLTLTIKPVSYTHLDVYKRQGLNSSLFDFLNPHLIKFSSIYNYFH